MKGSGYFTDRYTYEWSAFLLCMLHPEVEVRKCIGVQPDENYAIARVNKKIIKKLERKYQTSMMDDSIKILLPDEAYIAKRLTIRKYTNIR